MTIPQFIAKNLFRNRRRSILTTASVSISMFLLIIFTATIRYLQAPAESEGTRRSLLVLPRASTSLALPLSYLQRIAGLKGVDAVSPFTTFDGMYGANDAWVAGFSCNPDVFFKLFEGIRLPDEQRRAFSEDKRALIVGRTVARKFGWRIGDNVSIRNEGWHHTYEFTLRAIYAYDNSNEETIGVHWDYIHEAWPNPDAGGAYLVVAKTDQDARQLAKAIDDTFRHEPMETLTMAFLQFALDFLGRLGNVKAILMAVSGAVLFVILLVVANTMAMSIRERIPELAVLRVLGFRRWQLQGLLTVESLGLLLAGTGVGCGAAHGVFRLLAGYRVGGWMPIVIQIDLTTILFAFGAAIFTSLASTLIPAYAASRVVLSQALRYTG